MSQPPSPRHVSLEAFVTSPLGGVDAVRILVDGNTTLGNLETAACEAVTAIRPGACGVLALRYTRGDQ